MNPFLKFLPFTFLLISLFSSCEKDDKTDNFPYYVSIDGQKYKITIAATNGMSLYLLSSLSTYENQVFFETYTLSDNYNSANDYVGNYSFLPDCSDYNAQKGTFESIDVFVGANWSTKETDMYLEEGGCSGAENRESDGNLKIEKIGDDYEISFSFKFGEEHEIEGYYKGDIMINQESVK